MRSMAVLKNLASPKQDGVITREDLKAWVAGLGRLPLWTAAGGSLAATFGGAGDTAPPPATA
jgi:hypothetical protein